MRYAIMHYYTEKFLKLDNDGKPEWVDFEDNWHRIKTMPSRDHARQLAEAVLPVTTFFKIMKLRAPDTDVCVFPDMRVTLEVGPK